jgi:hypothetical protein
LPFLVKVPGVATNFRQLKSRSVAERTPSKGNTLYALVPRWPAGKLTLQDVHVPRGEKVTMLGVDRPLAWKPVNGGVEIEVPPLSVDDLPCHYAYVVKMPGGAL